MVSEKEVTMTGILVSMSVAMSWSGFVALVHDHRELQGSFAVSLRTPKAPLHMQSVLKGISSALQSIVRDDDLKWE